MCDSLLPFLSANSEAVERGLAIVLSATWHPSATPALLKLLSGFKKESEGKKREREEKKEKG
jgi:hypothetical protein